MALTKDKPWYKQKTTWTAILALVGAGAGVATGEAAVGDAIQVAIPALLALFLRDAIAKK